MFLQSINLIHCDLKPENILIYNDFRIKLIDFGSCHFFEAKEFQGPTPEYLAPEILMQNERNVFTVDVWSLGVLLLEIVIGIPVWISFKLKNDQIGIFGVKGRSVTKIVQK